MSWQNCASLPVTPCCHRFCDDFQVNRTDRLHALTEELRRTGPRGRTAGWLAGWLEVSARTVKRDVSALQQAGGAIWATAGPGGGDGLGAGAPLPPVNLTPAQAVAVAVALAGAPDAPFAVDGRAALQKVLDVMGPAARVEAEWLAGRVWVRGSSPGRPDPPPPGAGAPGPGGGGGPAL